MIPVVAAPHTAHIARAACPEAASLLHNMSAPPKTVVKFSGLSSLAGPALAPARTHAQRKYTAPGRFGTLLRFELAPEWRTLTPTQMLARLAALGQTGAAFEEGSGDALGDPPSDALGDRPSEAQAADAAQRLAALIDAHARRLPLPPGCAVVASHPCHAAPWGDPLTALAILSKCTDTVWLRDKQPSLTGSFERGAVSLLVPPGFDVPPSLSLSLPGIPDAVAKGPP